MKPAPSPDSLLTAQEAAAILGVHRSFVTRHAAQIGAVRVGSLLRVSREALDRYIAQQAITEPAPATQPAPTPIRQPRASGETRISALDGKPYAVVGGAR